MKLHFSITAAEELRERRGGPYVLYSVCLEGFLLGKARYSQLRRWDAQLRQLFGSAVPAFPPKFYLAMTKSMADERRSQLEQYLQNVTLDSNITHSEVFIGFFRKLQQDTFKIQTQTAFLDVYLADGSNIRLDIQTSDTAERILEVTLCRMGLSRELIKYFSLFFFQDHDDGALSVVKKVAEFELPYVSLQSMKELCCKLGIRKWYMDPSLDTLLMDCRASLNLLYMQAIQEVKRNWLKPTERQMQELEFLQKNANKAKFLELIREMQFYGYIRLDPCICDYPEEGCSADIYVGNNEINCCIKLPTNQIKDVSFKINRLRSWQVAFLGATKSLAVFKGKGTGDYEIHHGKKILYDIVAFAKESVNSHVITLGPQNFPDKEKEPWLVDFFAPWCPPCRALLPELRKASKHLYGQLKFGTLDCTVHEGLCNMHNIRAYPTTVVFNQSDVHEYEGHHSAEQILEFIEDLRNPSVVSLTPETFVELVQRRKREEIWMVDFYAPWCGPCQALMPEWKKMARMLNGLISVGSVDCQKYYSFCHQENVRGYPEIRLFPQKSNTAHQYFSYNGWHRDSYSLRGWGLGYLPQVSVDLTPQSFTEKVLNGKDHWVIDFYAPWCGPCQNFAPEFEILARMVKGKVKAGKVDCQAYAQTCQTADIRAYPTVKFYPYQGTKKNVLGEYIDSRDAKGIADLLNEKLEAIQNKGKRKKSRNKDEL